MEVDCQFVLVSGYPNLHRFANGVFTENHHWTVHEYKAMRKVTVGMLAGLIMNHRDFIISHITLPQFTRRGLSYHTVQIERRFITSLLKGLGKCRIRTAMQK